MGRTKKGTEREKGTEGRGKRELFPVLWHCLIPGVVKESATLGSQGDQDTKANPNRTSRNDQDSDLMSLLRKITEKKTGNASGAESIERTVTSPPWAQGEELNPRCWA